MTNGGPDVRRSATSRLWGITALALLAVIACVALGAWQFDRARTRDTPSAAEVGDPMARPPVAFRSVVAANGGRVPPGTQPLAVKALGHYDAEHQFVVPGRVIDGQAVDYVVTPLVSGSGEKAVLVVRGWVPADPSGIVQPPPAPLGNVSGVLGWLVPSEPLEAGTVDPLALPPGQVATVTAARIAGLLPYPIVDGYVGRVTELLHPTPSGGSGSVAEYRELTPVPVPQIAEPVRWSVQSLFYAFEWWFFALVVLWMWAQAVGIERRRVAAGAVAGGAQADDVPAVPPAP